MHSQTPRSRWQLVAMFAASVVALSCRTEVVAPDLPDPPPEVPAGPSTHPIVFSSFRDSTFGTNGARNLEILKMTEDGSGIVNISRHPSHDTDPAWSPDGRLVAFASNRAGSYDLYVMREDGSDIRPLTNDTMDERFPRWSPDGKHLVFEGPRDGLLPSPNHHDRYGDLFVVSIDGARLRNLTSTPAKHERWAAWSPDGNTIAYTRSDSTGTRIFLVNPDGTNPRPLRAADPDFTDDAAAWSPDGSRIAFSAFNKNHPPYTETYVILSARADGSDVHLLTGTGYESSRYPAWSPDGSRIVFNRDGVDEWWGRFSTQNVWIMNSDGSGKSRITQDPAKRNELGSPQAWRK